MNNLKANKSKELYFILFITSLSFIIGYFTIAYFNRHTADDFYGIHIVKTQGILLGTYDGYLKWEGSYAQFLSYLFASNLFMNSSSLIFFNLLNISFIVFSFSFFISCLLAKFQIKVTLYEKITIVLTFISALFFCTINIGETWYWLNGSVSYLTPIGVLALGFGFYFKKPSFINKFMACLFFFYFCGSRLNYSVFICILFSTIMLYDFYKFRSISRLTNYFPYLFAIGIGTFIYILAPGNYLRSPLKTPRVVENPLGELVYNSLNFFLPLINRIPFFLLLTIPILIWLVKKKIKLKKEVILWGAIFTGIYIFCQFLLMYVIYHQLTFGVPRTWLLIQLFVYTITLLTIANLIENLKPVVTTMLYGAAILGCIMLYSMKVIFALPALEKYSLAYDEREDKLKELKTKAIEKKIDTVFLKVLPPPYPINVQNEISGIRQARSIKYVINGKLSYLYYNDIGPHNSYESWINNGIIKAYSLPFYIDIDTKN